VLGGPTLSGLALGLVFWLEALTPTLIARSWLVQAVTSGVCLAIGYGIGTLVGHWVQRLLVRSDRLPGGLIRRRGWIVLGVAWVIAVPVGAVVWLGWQNEQREFMGIQPTLDWFDALRMVALSAVVGVLLVLVGRVIANGVGAVNRVIGRRLPDIVAVPVTAALIALLVFAIGGKVLVPALTALAESLFAPANEETEPGLVMPTSPAVSGSPASYVAWDTLGRLGRRFAATATTAEELAQVHGANAELAEPVRVYVGMHSADSAAQRAELAVRELERAGGFDRKVLVVWVPTGTGWVIEHAAAAIEQLYRGNSAIVAIQYSALPSLVGVFLDAGQQDEAGDALFNAVYAHWSQLSPDHRPKLLLFGKSLGTSGVEAPFVGEDAASSVANMVARTDGMLIVGAKESNPIHGQLTRAREPGSPIWQPIFDGGRSVRFVNRDPNQPVLDPNWPPPRIVYLQHPSDPVTFWSLDAIWRPQEFMAPPLGFDVPRAMRWFPIVSGVQAVGDLLDQLAPPPGFGHVYSTDYVRAWVSILPPDNWTEADTQRVEKFVDAIDGDESE
jgi:uncharacterized membrane protein